LTLFGTTHVRINSEKIAQEILAKRGANYSNRAPTPNIPGTKVDAEYLPLLDNHGNPNSFRQYPAFICTSQGTKAYSDVMQNN